MGESNRDSIEFQITLVPCAAACSIGYARERGTEMGRRTERGATIKVAVLKLATSGTLDLIRVTLDTQTLLSGSNSRDIVRVELGARSYEIVIGSGILERLPELLSAWLSARSLLGADGRKAHVVTDSNVAARYAEPATQLLRSSGWNCGLSVLDPGEQTKSLRDVSRLYDDLVSLKADRRTVVIAIGGGVIGDLAGFVAATYARGVPFVQVPTTLLAHVDSSVGGKVGINHASGKNLIGAFHQPVGVLIDTNVLGSLPEREYRAGLAEVVKYGVILDAEFFRFLEENATRINSRDAHVLRQIISRCCRLKADVVERDEFETTGLRAVLNYGHTFAHAFEALAGYGELSHGEAVSIGMIHASRLAERLGRIPAEATTRQRALLESVGCPTRLPSNIKLKTNSVVDAMRLDKKTVGNKLRFVLPTRIGHVELVSGVDETHVHSVLDE